MISGALLWLKLPFLLGTAGIAVTLIFFSYSKGVIYKKQRHWQERQSSEKII